MNQFLVLYFYFRDSQKSCTLALYQTNKQGYLLTYVYLSILKFVLISIKWIRFMRFICLNTSVSKKSYCHFSKLWIIDF